MQTRWSVLLIRIASVAWRSLLFPVSVQIRLAAGCNRRQSIGSWGNRKRFGGKSRARILSSRLG
jgi:hypothetical protein